MPKGNNFNHEIDLYEDALSLGYPPSQAYRIAQHPDGQEIIAEDTNKQRNEHNDETRRTRDDGETSGS